MKTWILAVVLAAIAVAPVLYVVYYKQDSASRKPPQPALATVQFQPENRPMTLEPGAVFVVRSCQVLDGYQFVLGLDGGLQIDAHLPVATKDEAIPIVIELLSTQQSSPPSVTLLRKVGDIWIAHLEINVGDKRLKLVEHLRAKELLLN